MSVTVFCYHAVVAEPLALPHFCFLERGAFHRQLVDLKSQYDVLPLRTALDRLWGEEPSSGDRPAAALTFDDGYQNMHDIVLPELRELEMPAACFINSSAVATGRPLWFSR